MTNLADLEEGIDVKIIDVEESKQNAGGGGQVIPKVRLKKQPMNDKANGKGVYTVEEILDKQLLNGRVYYKIKWEGYSESESTWEPLKNLGNVRGMIKEFNKKNIYEDEAPSDEEIESSDSDESVEDMESKAASRRQGKKKSQGIQPAPAKPEHKKTTREKPAEKQPVLQKNPAIPPSSRNEFGSFSAGDEVESIRYSSHGLDQDSNEVLYFIVHWKPRRNGFVPLEAIYSNRQLREYAPRSLVDFYEERLKFVKMGNGPPAKTKK